MSIWAPVRGAISSAVQSPVGLLLGLVGEDGGVSPALDWWPAGGAFTSLKGPTPQFSRASGATMVDVNGNVVWGPENLLRFSGDFTNSSVWAPSNATLATGISDPDGGTAATRLTPTGVSNIQQGALPSSGTPATFSVWLRSTTGSNISTAIYIAGVEQPVTITPTWQRFSVTNPAPLTSFSVYIASDGQLGVGEVIDMWHPQVERSSIARPYIPTTSAPVYGPRITYDPVSHECLGYLAEEQRTNKIFPSNSIATGWTVNDGSISTAPGAPDGGDWNVWTAGNSGISRIYRNIIPDPGNNTLSFYAAKDAGRFIHIRVESTDPSGNFGKCINLGTGALTVGFVDGMTAISAPVSAHVTDAGNGAWRMDITFLLNVASNVFLYFSDNASSTVPSAAGVTFRISDFQYEAGSFHTSYIPTTTAAATRSADVCQIGGTDFTSFYNQSEGTVVAGAQLPSVNQTAYLVSSNIGDYGNSIDIHKQDLSGLNGNTIRATIFTSGASVFSNVFGANSGNGSFKASLAYKSTDSIASLNGTIGTLDTSSTMPPTDRLDIGFLSPAGSTINGTIARIQYFNKRLPDADLVKLTSP